MPAGLPKEELKRGHKLARSSSKGVPLKDLLFTPEGRGARKHRGPHLFDLCRPCRLRALFPVVTEAKYEVISP